MTTMTMEREWARKQVEEYQRRYKNYILFADVLGNVLKHICRKYAPLAIVQTRPKTIASFAEKCQRKRGKYNDSVNQFTDLCGGRVIVHTADEVKAISAFIETHFEIDQENSIDVTQRLKPTEFGYRSVHYIIGFKPGIFPNKEVPLEIPPLLWDQDKFPNHRAEIQVRTILEHAWADMAHALVYKSAFPFPAKWEREFAGVAAMLEGADKSFSRIKEGLTTYASCYGAYMTQEQMVNEMQLLEIILAYDQANTQLAGQIGKLAITCGDWQKAIDILTKHKDSGEFYILRDLGIALCKMHKAKPTGKEFKLGQRYLELACQPPHQDADALASLAGTWKKIDEEKARELYRKAFQIDASDPYPLENYLDLEISIARDVSIISMLAPVIKTAIQRCKDQAEVGVNLPWAYYMMGKFFLLLNEPYKSLEAYAKAIELSSTSWVIDSALNSVDRLKVVSRDLEGYDWVYRLLLMGKTVFTVTKAKELSEAANPCGNGSLKASVWKEFREKSKEAKAALEKLRSLAIKQNGRFATPVLILAGGCDPSVEEHIKTYRELLMEAFRDFRGTIIGGGTREGVSGLVGELGQAYAGSIYTIGYLPGLISIDTKVDRRYHEIRETSGSRYSPFESLQYWIDLITSGVEVSDIKVLGINGGMISAMEYRMALALGATVGVVEESGREVAKLLQDEKWMKAKKLLILPADVMTLRAFIGSAGYRLEEDIRQMLAKEIHKSYCLNRQDAIKTNDPALTNWECLPECLKESNAQQADHIFEKLSKIGCQVRKVTGREVDIFAFTGDEIEFLAQIEHGRWNIERLTEGWIRSLSKDVANKKSPYLVGWHKLPEEIKEWDRTAVKKIPECMAKAGLEIYKT
jgi:ppGpp synthetase/RelA/SpoT-type nucleotidyltranferase